MGGEGLGRAPRVISLFEPKWLEGGNIGVPEPQGVEDGGGAACAARSSTTWGSLFGRQFQKAG